MKTRIIQTRFWQDTFIDTLDHKAKLLFIYLLSNYRVELTGAYELPISHMALETGLPITDVETALTAISAKIGYIHGYVIIFNHKKYQDYSKGNENQQRAFARELDNLPDLVQEALNRGFQLVDNQLPTSYISSSQLDINKKTEIRNKKTEIRKEQEFSKKYFKENWEQILAECKVEFSDNPLYEDKDFDRVMQEFLEGTEIKDYKYKNYRLAYLKWLRNSNHTVNQRLIGTKTKLAIN